MRKLLIASVSALATLGMIGGCWVLANDGFTASGKRGQWPVFVPAPQAYVIAAILLAMSAIAVLWLLREAKLGTWACTLWGAAYLGAAFAVTRAMGQAVGT
jgi:hypothetical protein